MVVDRNTLHQCLQHMELVFVLLPSLLFLLEEKVQHVQQLPSVRKHFKTPGGCLKQQTVPNPVQSLFFLMHMYL